jgi:hypothetical protein
MHKLACILAVLCAAAALQAAPDVTVRSAKLGDDPRLRQVVDAMPAVLEDARARLESALGVAGPLDVVDIEIADVGNRRSATRALTREVRRDGRTRQLIILHAEHLAIAPQDAPALLAHELKHALFRARMGAAYDALPVWVREGLAVYGAGQLKDRTALVIGAAVFAGRDPLDLPRMPGSAAHTAWDYPVSAAAFEWLAGHGCVHAYCTALLAGVDAEAAFGRAAGFEPQAALAAALEHARALFRRELGDAGREFLRLRDGDDAEALQAWADANPGHALYANALFRAGRALVRAGEHERGRELLRAVQGLHHRSVLADDAMHWIVRSHELAGDSRGKAAARKILQRDYGWSRHAT